MLVACRPSKMLPKFYIPIAILHWSCVVYQDSNLRRTLVTLHLYYSPDTSPTQMWHLPPSRISSFSAIICTITSSVPKLTCIRVCGTAFPSSRRF